jgi:hypothetical protein
MFFFQIFAEVEFTSLGLAFVVKRSRWASGSIRADTGIARGRFGV